MRSIITLILAVFTINLSAQIVAINPSEASGDDEITITFDANEGTAGLVGATKVYMHSGIITDGPNGVDWQNVVGNWGQDDGIGEMEKVNGESDKWQITITPRDYYSASTNTTIFRLAMVFRNASGSAEGKGNEGTFDGGEVTSNGDIFIDLQVDNYVRITNPTDETVFIESGQAISISAEASSDVSDMKVLINEGSGFSEKTSVTSGTTINYDFSPTQSFNGTLRVTATINGVEVIDEQALNVNLTDATTVAALPEGVVKGINYHDDLTKVTLVLEAPGKDFVYAVGDFNNWEINSDYLMNVTPDGELFWIQLTGLTAQQEYVFQYWVEGAIKIGDPYTEKVADPWNDRFISSTVHNAIPNYSRTKYGVASTLQTGQSAFQWNNSEANWQRPAQEDLVIYELLVRDFIGTHDYKDMIDTLDYIQELGVNAIELMPIMEFEGNESWGYNPMYFFAPDKYYGTKDDLKNFIQACHERGIAVILDMVLNHAFGLNPMVRMYWDPTVNKPSSDSPWFNRDATHPFNVGFDFNHESTYTQDFVDSVNAYWIDEYHFDGYRFDLSKGFTQTNNPSDVGAWSAKDDSRIALLKRMNDHIKTVDSEAYVILEHFADSAEETELAAEGMILWRNMGYAYHQALGGHTSDSFQGASVNSHVSYMESHDEQRQLYEVMLNGLSQGDYNTRDTTIALERLKSNAAFLYTLPGPKMLWQFGELGYDIDINQNGRTGNKPLPWGNDGLGYYENALRKYVYDAFSQILGLREQIDQQANIQYDYNLNGETRYIIVDSDDLDVVIIGNFSLSEGSIDYSFTETGDWFDYFEGSSLDITDVASTTTLSPGEFRIFTNNQISEGFENVVEAYQNPITVSPAEFDQTTQITITFDATKANPDQTNGLVGASKVYIHAGVVYDSYSNTTLQNIVGNLTDDGIGQMSQVAGETDKWEITFTSQDYFSITNGEPLRIGMYFRDASNSNVGKGFRGSLLFANMRVDGEMVSISPESFDQNTEITLTFNSRVGDRGLENANKVYIHTGVVTDSETGTDWQNVIGNWGQDDGIGAMAQVTGAQGLWEITFTPSDYYDLASYQQAYRLSMVFRNADGSRKGGNSAGSYAWGEIAENGDIYYDVPERAVVASIDDEEVHPISIYPNPTSEWILISTNNFENIESINLFDLNGNILYTQNVKGTVEPIGVQNLQEGLYLLRIVTGLEKHTVKVMVRKD